ncbi:hypothetical protein FH717_23215 [Bacteroides thetaiotaomicron]|nr:hypothetical protein [Bacteroides thetaiotaomicron]MBL3940155.1 hypothetical protein [Bacteroides thetaiotaomicron]
MKEIKRDANTRILFGRNSKKTYICHVIFFIVLDLRLTKVGARRCSFFMPQPFFILPQRFITVIPVLSLTIFSAFHRYKPCIGKAPSPPLCYSQHFP